MKSIKYLIYILNIMFLLGIISVTYSVENNETNKTDSPAKISITSSPVILDVTKLKKIDFQNEVNPLKVNRPAPPEQPVIDDGWETIFSENFEGSFPTGLWQLYGAGWNDNSVRYHNGNWSVWCAEDNNSGPAAYSNNMQSWMIYGPFDLSDPYINEAKVSFYHWTRTENTVDPLLIGKSTTGLTFNGYLISGDWTYEQGNVNGWVKFELDLSDLIGQTSVWFALRFLSNSSVVYEGVYIDDITISKFIKLPTMTITDPNGGESWDSGTLHNITWTSSGLNSTENVKLEYTSDYGTNWSVIVDSTPNNGSFAWTIPDAPSTQCKVRVTTVNGLFTDESDNFFTIKQRHITLSSPNGGESWAVGSRHNLTWTSYGTSGSLNFDYTINDGASWTRIFSDIADDGSKSWTVPNTPSNSCRVRITDKNSSLYGQSESVFSITSDELLSVTAPNGGEIWQIGSSQNITWTSSKTGTTVKIEYSINNGTDWSIIVSSTPNDGTHPWIIPSTASGNCLVRVTDTDGYPTDQSNGVFTITTGEELVITAPDGGEIWEAESAQNITWTSSGIGSTVKIEYSVNNGTDWFTIIASTPNDGTHSWTVPDTPSENCLVRISDTDGSPVDTSNTAFTITEVPAGLVHFTNFVPTEDYYPVLIYAVNLEGIAADHGDEVGVFASDGLGGEICAGAVLITGTPPYSLQAWGDNSQTTAKDGFTAGESLHFRFWDSSNQVEWGPESGSNYTLGNGTWGNGTLAEINPLEFNEICSITINMSPGWNWISSNVIPDDPEMITIWEEIDNLNIIKARNGFYIPEMINTIGNWDVSQMYQVNVQTAQQLVIIGTCVAANTPINLASGWNWTSYYPAATMDAETALASIAEKLNIAMARSGFYIPGTINSIGNLTPGTGYKLNLNEPATLVYAEAESSSPGKYMTNLAKTTFIQGSHYSNIAQSNDYHAIVITSINIPNLKAGTEVAIFTESNQCVGSAVYTGHFPMAIMAWADNEETSSIDGYKSGEQMVFKVWDNTVDTEIAAGYTVNQGTNVFGASPYTAVSLNGVEKLPVQFNLKQNYPNPFNPTTTIQYELPEAARVDLSIYNVNGVLIKTLVNEYREAGNYSVVWDGTNMNNKAVSSGVYFYRLDSQDFKIMKKLTFIK